ncbi:MAG: polysaccharide biosynthesis/export family protein, partial [Planctomycetota bacterium]|nr:polysaccharide biosynthesis/export family protein [Planctomycetota bacterium]
LLIAAMPNSTRCQADETAKQNTLHKAAQQWMQVGIEQYNRSLFKAAGQSFRRAAVFRGYLTAAEQKKLTEFQEKASNARLAKELTSTKIQTTDRSAQPTLSAKVVALSDRSAPTAPPARVEVSADKPVRPVPPIKATVPADSVKEGRLLTKKEQEILAVGPIAAAGSPPERKYVADKPIAAASSPPEREKIQPKAIAPTTVAATTTPRRPTQAASSSRVAFQAGDVIEIKFFFTPELNITQTVRPDGKISLELIPEVTAKGKTAAELRYELLRLYEPHLKAPEIAVVARSFYTHRVFVGGQVMKPGVVEMPGEMTALEAIMETGGFDLRAAERKAVIVIRYTNGRRYAYKLDLKQAIEGNETKPFYLEPKDIVHVPRTKIAKLNQWIDQHINKIIPDTGFFFRKTSGNTSYGAGSYR